MNNDLYKYFLLIFIVFIIQISFFVIKPVAGIKPDILLVIVIIIGLLKGVKIGGLLGFGAGLLQDMFFYGIPGGYTVIKLISGGFIGALEGKFFEKNYLFPFFLIITGTIFQEFFLLFLSAGTFFGIDIFNLFNEIILPVALYNGILGLILYPIFYKILKIGDKRLWIRN